MAAAAASLSSSSVLSSSLTHHPLRPKLGYPLQYSLSAPHSTPRSFKIHAKLGGGKGEKAADKKKFITKEQEPEQYWQSAGEREGENPMKTPLPYIIIFGMSTPFIILAIAFANGWIKAPIR